MCITFTRAGNTKHKRGMKTEGSEFIVGRLQKICVYVWENAGLQLAVSSVTILQNTVLEQLCSK